MRIALLQPTYWPEVTRGGERLAHDLGAALAARGHEVSLLTSHRRRRSVTREEGLHVIRSWRPPRPPLLGMHELHVENVPASIARLLRGEFDVAHALFPSEAWAAVLARRLGGPPVICTLLGIPTREYLVARRYRLEMLSTVVREAAAVTVLSEAAARPFRRYLLRDPDVIPPGLYCEQFAAKTPRAAVPTVFCAASLGDPRKRATILFEAYERLREWIPEARLEVVGSEDPIMSGSEVRLPEGAAWREPDSRPEALGRAYATAWTTVLPAVHEAFGLVLVESLAAGTPVVAARSGAGPEIVDSDAVGRLFEPDQPEDLARALEEALRLASAPETADACRRRAAAFDWSRVVERYDELYRSAVDGTPAAAIGAGVAP